jgi:hypothetical protein
MAKQIISLEVPIKLVGESELVDSLPIDAELVHVRLIGPQKAVLTFIADPMKEKKPVLFKGKLTGDFVPTECCPYYAGTAQDGYFVYHLFSSRPLDPYNSRHYTNEQPSTTYL